MKSNNSIRKILLIQLVIIGSLSCKQDTKTIGSVYSFVEPAYRSIELVPAGDTLSFRLDSTTYATIKSFNLFVHKGVECFAFYDERSESINIYKFQTQEFIKKIRLRRWVGNSLYKTSVFVRNFDSIFVNNMTNLILFDRNGNLKQSIDFLERPAFSWAVFENTSLPVIKDKKLFAAVRPNVNDGSVADLKKWKVLYEFDLQHSKATLYYSLPDMYQHNLFGDHFLEYNYCVNAKGHFVFSFPADTNIYETDLSDYHVAYYARSRFQTGMIAPLTDADMKDDETKLKQYKVRDAYGAIFFDPYNKRYLRLAKRKISEADYASKKRERKQSVIILDENFRIMSEPEVPVELSWNTLVFSVNGNMYVRVNSSDENAIHFAQLDYKETTANSLQQLSGLKHPNQR